MTHAQSGHARICVSAHTYELNRYTKAVPQRAEVAMWPRPKPDVAMMESEVY